MYIKSHRTPKINILAAKEQILAVIQRSDKTCFVDI